VTGPLRHHSSYAICLCGWPERLCLSQSQHDGDDSRHDERIEAREADDEEWRQIEARGDETEAERVAQPGYAFGGAR
jgi:hypothetical protein